MLSALRAGLVVGGRVVGGGGDDLAFADRVARRDRACRVARDHDRRVPRGARPRRSHRRGPRRPARPADRAPDPRDGVGHRVRALARGGRTPPRRPRRSHCTSVRAAGSRRRRRRTRTKRNRPARCRSCARRPLRRPRPPRRARRPPLPRPPPLPRRARSRPLRRHLAPRHRIPRLRARRSLRTRAHTSCARATTSGASPSASSPARAGTRSTDADVARYWQRVIAANRTTLRSGDPSLIFPGEVVTLPLD